MTVVTVVTSGKGRLVLGAAPPDAPACERCPQPASLILVTTPVCKACLIALVERGLGADQ